MLLRAIDSALNQTYQNIEILVVDDNNPDDEYSKKVKELVTGIQDARVRLIRQKKHINGAVARNVGIREALGKYVAFLDDDDEWLPEKIKKQLFVLRSMPDCSGCTCLYIYSLQGRVIRKCPPYSTDRLQFKLLIRNVHTFTSTLLLDRAALLESGGFAEELLRYQDAQMLICFLRKNKITALREHYVIIHKDSAINRIGLRQQIEIQAVFLAAMKDIIGTYSKSDQKRIYAAYNFELAIKAVKEKNIMSALRYIKKIGFYYPAIIDFIVRINDNRKAHRL
jgi:glycosyltransferase involved in cell wall biosynthesis